MSNFQEAVGLLIEREGRTYTNDPTDSGGATKFGITIPFYDQYEKSRKHTAQDIMDLTENLAIAMYHANLWMPMNLDLIKDVAVADMLLDQGANWGKDGAVKRIQAVLKDSFKMNIGVDGDLGSLTARAINSIDADRLIVEYVEAAEDAYANIVVNRPTQIKFLRGWLNRAHYLLNLIFKRSKSID